MNHSKPNNGLDFRPITVERAFQQLAPSNLKKGRKPKTPKKKKKRGRPKTKLASPTKGSYGGTARHKKKWKPTEGNINRTGKTSRKMSKKPGPIGITPAMGRYVNDLRRNRLLVQSVTFGY